MVVNSIKALEGLGWSPYEARAYVSLLSDGPCTAYELAKASGLPSSKVYEVLARLEERRAAQERAEGGRRLWQALEGRALVADSRRRLGGLLGELESALGALDRPAAAAPLWSLQDLSEAQTRTLGLIDQAAQSLLLSLWEEDLPPLLPALDAAAARGVACAAVLFGADDAEPGSQARSWGRVYPHPLRQTLEAEQGGRSFAACADGAQALWVHAGPPFEGVWTRNPGFVSLTEEFIRHDIYLMKVVARYGADLLRRFGPGFGRLRDVFTDEEA